MKFLRPEISIQSNLIANNLFNTWISLMFRKDDALVRFTGFFIYLSVSSHINRFSSHKKSEGEKNLPNSCRTQAWHICEVILGYSLPYADLPEVLFYLAKGSF